MLASAIEYLRVVCESETDQSELQATDEAEAFVGASTNLSAYDISRAGEDKLSSLNLERLLTLKGQLIELERLVDSLDVTEEGITKPSE
ncbi:hypothetical protein AHF37_05293 [Paragonimus kellicotti]|nr:hypothetical protein AHF37_05293 [Paragonimus kellicotti]